MSSDPKILFTGGSGLLGSEIRSHLPDALYPSSAEFDVSNLEQMEAWASSHEFDQVVHAAAFTSPPRIDEDPIRAIDANIIGTANVVKLCATRSLRLIYISTDYVFKGDKGSYREDDPVNPVNKYAWSKLGGECAARLYDKALIVRTSFGPNEFPYPKAFVDQWTSRESVAVLAEKIAKLTRIEATGTLHVGGKRRSVMEYAQGLDPSKEIKELSINEVSFDVPVDTSLDCGRYDELIDG